MLKEPRRKYMDIVFVTIISICLVLMLGYQVVNVMALQKEATPTPTPRPFATAYQGIPEVGEETFRPTPTPEVSPTPSETPFLE
ncbi:MAG: hypothetical protein ACLFWD_09970 [Anaerolineales bacterium]